MASKEQKLRWLLAGAASCLLYFVLAYKLNRTDTLWLQLTFSGLFVCFLFLLHTEQKWLLSFAVLFRVIFLFSLPALSDDFYRFIWDGILWHQGIHPFAHTPSSLMQSPLLPSGITPELFKNLNSQEYYTVYPPLHQLVFWLSTISYGGNIMEAVIPMRLILLIADLAFVGFLLKTAKNAFASRFIAFYALNPLVIIETTGNLHFEGMATFFLMVALYFISNRKVVTGSAALAAAVATKLTPLIAGPALLLTTDNGSRWKFLLPGCIFTLLLFLPLLEPIWLGGQTQSLSLYFKKFEFNASLYYLFREVGFWMKGYNVISSLGPSLAVASAVLILLISWSKSVKFPTLYHTVSVVFLVYYLFATTVHPWYIVPLVGLSVFTGYLFPLVWSYTIFWTYIGYTSSGYEVPWGMIALEYLLVVGVFLWEVVLPLRRSERIKNQT